MEEPPRKKRFTFQSYADSLKSVHLPSATLPSALDEEIPDASTHFNATIQSLRQLNLSPSFIKFADKVEKKSISLPLLVHHWKEIVDEWISEASQSGNSNDSDGSKALLQLLQTLIHELRTTISPSYIPLLHTLLSLFSSSLPSETLTILLSTLALFFKSVFLPSLPNAEFLQETWTALKSTLESKTSGVEGRRMLGEVLGGVLRKMKPDVRDELIGNMMVKDLEEGDWIEDSCTWAFVTACKAPVNTLHPCTGPLLTILISSHLAVQQPSYTHRLLRRVLTSLAHHVQSAPQYEIASDLLVTQFAELTAEDATGNEEKVVRFIGLLEVITSVRKGSRMKQPQLSQILTQVSHLPPSLRTNTIKLLTAVLTAAEMPVWIGVGRRAIEWVWEDKLLGVKIAGTLSEMGWTGWDSILLPYIVKNIDELLESHSSETLNLLVSLKGSGKLQNINETLKESLGGWAEMKLGMWDRSDDEQIYTLTATLQLAAYMPTHLLTHLFLRIINLTLDSPNRDFKNGFLLAELFGVLAESPIQGHVDILKWLRVGIEGWSWCAVLLDGLVKITEARWARSTPPQEVPYGLLYPSILSHSRALRLAALHLLSSHLIQTTASQHDVIQACLAAEEVPLEVGGVRARVLKLSRVSATVKDGDTKGLDIALRWLVSQLKVNFRPLWEPTSAAILTLINRFPEESWDLIFDQLQQDHFSISKGEQDLRVSFEDEDGSVERSESEKTWRCPNIEKVDKVVRTWEGGRLDSERRRLSQAQHPSDRLDALNFESLVLKTLSECPQIVEKHSRAFIPFFLTQHASLSRLRLTSYLTLFSKFSNPKALYQTSTLQDLHCTLISMPDRSLQSLSLSCLLSYKSPHLIPYEDNFRSLLDDTKWRDELVLFDIGAIEAKDRPEVIGVLIRLLYGLLGERKGRGKGADKKSAILSALAACDEAELRILMDLMLKPFGGLERHLSPNSPLFEFHDVGETPLKQHVGFLMLLGDALPNLGARLLPYWPSLIGTTMDILHSSQRGIGGGVATGEIPEEDTPEDAEDEGDPTDTPEFGTRKPMRTARQLGLKRFADFFRSSTPFDFQPYMSSAFPSFISPRLPALKVESVQAPSALLELFYTWTNRRDTCFYFVDYDAAVLPEVFSCLTVPSVKPAVISRIFDLIDRLLMISSDDSEITTRVIHPNVGSLLSHVSTLSERIADPKSTVTDLARRQIGILSSLASYITNGDQATHLLQLFLPLLRKPVKMVPERTKVDVLTIIVNLLPQIPDIQNAESPMFIKTYSILSSLFHTLRTRQSRLALVDAFSKLVSAHPLLHTIAELITSLNAFSIKRSEEPDFDRRLAAFASLNESLYSDFSAQHWLPIIHNMLQFIQDADELAVRNSAALTLRRFVEMAATSHDGEITTLFDNVMYPGLRNALRSKLELVRTEVLGVLAYGIATCESQPALLEMRPLLAAGDEEANFFNNVHHVQIHRRTRALRRLAERCSDNQIRSITLAEVFVPLVEHFILGTGTADHHLVNEAISTMGKMAHSLAWGAYNMLVRKYLKLAQEKSSSERVFIRTVVAILENFHFNMNESVTQVENVDDEDEGLQEEHDDSNRETLTKARQTARIADAVNSRLLPTLLGYLEKREETEDTIRISVCPGIVKVAQHLPEPLKDAQISRLITILSQVFRSKSQETRDVARDTMGKIAVSLGPQYLPQIIKELRAALLRGPHLHILAFITHALLVQVTSVEEAEFNPDLDGCVVDVAHVSAEVIFGQSGKDLQSEDFRTKVREVRSSPSKGLDSFMILAKYITPPKLSILLHPIRAIMYETQTAKMMQKVDEVLGRIATGLNANKHLDPSNLLVLCHTLISQNAKFLTEAPQVKRPKHKVKAEFAVQIKRDVPKEGDHYAHNSAKLVAFGFDLFVTAFRRGRFDFRDDGILSRLEPMVPLIEKALHSNDAQVVSLALKVSAAVIKCPLAALDDSLQPIIQQTLDVIVQAGSSESEVVQTAFKSLGTIIRDNSKAVVKEKDLTFLLELITTDLEEVDRQAAAFSLLRAIVSRKLVVPEIYDLMEKVSDVMVTSQSTLAQELCRGVLLQFLLDYPQGKKRLQKHMAFLAKNLSYVFESGRKSVMELLSAVFSKFDEGLLREYNDLFFVALVMVIANDDSPKCREMAAELIKSLFLRSDADQRRALSGHLHSWTIQNQKPKLASVGAQVYGLFLDVLRQDAQPYLPNLLKDLRARIEQSAELFADLENSSADETDPMELDIDWQIAYQSLTSLAKALRHFPNLTTSIDNVPWNAIIGHCLFPHAWVRSAAARLIGVLFTAIPIAKPTNTGVMTKSTLMEIARLSCLQLRSPTLDKALGLQIVKNLFYLGKTFCLYTPLDGGASNRLGVKRDHAEDDEGNGDEESMGYDDAEQNEGGEPGDSVDTNENPLPWLFSKLSYQVRSALIKRRNHFLGTDNWSQEPASVLRWFAAMGSHMDGSVLERFLVHILTPLYRIVDEETIKDAQMDELKTLAQELQDLVQTKVGTTKFASVYNRLRQGVLDTRRDRKRARVIQATNDPERTAKRKMHRNVMKKDNRKRKSQAFVAGKLKKTVAK